MRLASLLVLGLAALAPATDALRTSASSTLARLSQRLAAAEAALAELKASSQLDAAPGPTPTSQYTFDLSNYADKYNTANKGVVAPTGANNIGFIADNSRASQVVVRNPSNTYSASTLSFPNQLASSFTLGVWVNWGGVSNGVEQHVVDSSDSSFQLFLDGNGYYNAVVNGVKITDTFKVSSLTWRFLAVAVDSSAQTFRFWSGNSATLTKVNTVTATYPGSAPKITLFNYAAGPVSAKQWAGEVDSITIFNSALSDSDLADVWWGTNNGASPTGQPTGQAPINNPYAYVGHFAQSQVTFSNRYAGQPAGDVSITIAVADSDVVVGDEIRVRMYGCTGTPINSNTGYLTLADGNLVSYNTGNGMVSILPQQSIPTGTTYTFNLPAKQYSITNPTTLYASASDPNWKIGIIFGANSQNSAQTGIHYEGVKITPATINPNPQLL